VQHPPSPKKAMLIVAVVVICLLIVGAEMLFGWPEWLTVNNGIRR